MRPNTVHLVLTTENAITRGSHFYSAATIRRSYYGDLHAFISGSSITNIDHPPSRRLMRVIMANWTKWYRDNAQDGPDNADLDPIAEQFRKRKTAHVPDVSTCEGLLDVIAIGNLLEISPIVDMRAYCRCAGPRSKCECRIPPLDLLYQEDGRTFYENFIDFFVDHFEILHDDELVDPISWLFDVSTPHKTSLSSYTY